MIVRRRPTAVAFSIVSVQARRRLAVVTVHRVILLQAAQPTSSEAMFDQRLFNQSAGMVMASASFSCSLSCRLVKAQRKTDKTKTLAELK